MEVTVVIPCLDEEKYVGDLLDDLSRQIEPAEVIVADCHSADKTVKIAKSHGAKVVFAPYKSASSARNAGAKQAKTKYVLFLDADTRISEGFVKNMLEKITAKELDLLSPRFTSSGLHPFDHVIAMIVNLWLIWSIVIRRKPLVAGTGFLIKKSVHDSVGGFDEKIREFDDVYYSKKLQKTKCSSGFAWRSKVISSNRRAVRQGRIQTAMQQLPDDYFLVKKVIRPAMKRLGISGKWAE